MIDWTQMVTAETRAAAALAEAKAGAHATLAAMLDAAADAITGVVPMAERLSWPQKEAAARAHLAGAAAAEHTALLAAEVAVTGQTPDALAARIVARADAFRAAVGRLSGLRTATAQAIDRADTVEAVQAALAGAQAALRGA